jgi:small subunit ribosomal protein S20
VSEVSVANIKSQIKRNSQNEKRRLRNRAVRSELRTREKAAEAAVGSENEAEALRLAIKRIDKAAAKGVVHKNAAARRKSRLIARLRQSASSEA